MIKFRAAALCGIILPLAAQEWRFYGGDQGSAKYSPLDQINRANIRFQRPDVGAVDLIERRIFCAALIAAVESPFLSGERQDDAAECGCTELDHYASVYSASRRRGSLVTFELELHLE